MPDPVAEYLRTLNTSDRARAAAWDAVYVSKTPEERQQRLAQLPFSDDVRADLWDIAEGGTVAGGSTPQPATAEQFMEPSPTAPASGFPRGRVPTGKPGFMSNEDWAQLTPNEKLRNGLNFTGKWLMRSFTDGDTADAMMDNPGTTLATAGLTAAAPVVAKALPNFQRAGTKFQTVMGATKDVPIDISKPGELALRVQDLAGRGGSMPKAVRDFLKRVTDPGKAPMTYDEARDFYSNLTRLSADESRRLTPVMRRSVAEFTRSLNDSITKAASSVGQGTTYQSAMKEYHRAAQLAQTGRRVKDQLVKYAIPGGLVAAGYKAASEFWDGR